MIEGSNEIVWGEVANIQDLRVIVKNSDRLSKLGDILLLGLYIIGEKDVMTVSDTNFILASKITPNLNCISDGAISLRFDDSSENSFLTEAFKTAKSAKKIVSVYLSQKKNIVTIGGMSMQQYS